ncbi:MAG: hypothetical protein K2Q12_07290 [Rickettsiales bacterium]|nr:hypothetical protein [Rickettsiales bacterium]
MKSLEVVIGFLGISGLAAASRTAISPDGRGLRGFCRRYVMAGFAGTVTGLLIQDLALSAPTQGGIIGIAAFVADDLLLVLVAVAARLREDPTAIIDYIFKRGGK